MDVEVAISISVEIDGETPDCEVEMQSQEMYPPDHIYHTLNMSRMGSAQESESKSLSLGKCIDVWDQLLRL